MSSELERYEDERGLYYYNKHIARRGGPVRAAAQQEMEVAKSAIQIGHTIITGLGEVCDTANAVIAQHPEVEYETRRVQSILALGLGNRLQRYLDSF